MRIDYDLTKEDYLEYNLHFISTSETMKKSLFIQRYIISIMFLAAPFLVVKVSDIPLMYWIGVFLIIYMLWVGFYLKYFNYYIKKRIEKLVTEGKNASIFGNHSLILTEEGISETSSLGEVKTSWSAVEKIYDTEKYLYIYTSAVNAYVVPVRSFKSLEEKDEFVKRIKYKMGDINEK